MQDKKVLFHVHSWRCGHAEKVPDQVYIEKALSMRADEIVFTDHAPFPEDPFRNRMKMKDLDEYLTTLSELKDKYYRQIDIRIGLEIEYLPSFEFYYDKLKKIPQLDLLLLGQHHFEVSLMHYSFEEDFSDDKKARLYGTMNAQIKGVESGYFEVIAHPDRCMRDMKSWNPEIETLSNELIEKAIKHNVVLEKNLASMNHKKEYWPEFWKLVPPGTATITGCDAHFVKDLHF